MKYLIDTSVWSMALRRSPSHASSSEAVTKLRMLLESGERVFVTGIIFQEVLQGIRTKDHFAQVCDSLSSFPLLEPTKEDHLFAAELFNACRARGVQASTVDFLLAALSIRNECHLLTTDRDFERIALHSDLKLLS